jgi:TIR domain
MPKPRLFFSHSTQKGSAERDTLIRLAAALKADYEILLDREALEAGGNWRSTINVWLATCDAAVILVHPESVASAFCQYEWAVLSHRRDFQKKFLIIPIFLGSTPKDIALRPEQIAAVSGYFEFDAFENVIARVKDQLLRLVPEKPPGTLISYVASSLQGAILRDDAIENEAGKLDLDLGTWDFSTDKWLEFALKLMGTGLTTNVLQVLLKLQPFFGNAQADKFTVIIKLIGQCSWVDMGSAQRIRACALREVPTQGLFGLNAALAETAQCYVVTGSDTPGGNHWPVGNVLDDFAGEQHLHQRVRSALIALLLLADNASDAELRQELDLTLEVRPLFIVLRAEGMSADWLKRLCAQELFAGVNFLVLGGETIPPGLLPESSILTPGLPPGFEHEVWWNYERARRTLRIT